MKNLNIIQSYSSQTFEEKALEIFRFQAENTLVYREYLEKINCDIFGVNQLSQIPFLPISLFKTHQIINQNSDYQLVFKSSGTTNIGRSQHFIAKPELYEMSFLSGFKHFFGNPNDYIILALLPSYLEQQHSSLVYMVNRLIKESYHSKSGFYLHNYEELIQNLEILDASGKKVMLFGVAYALLDVVERKKLILKNTIIMETGGMKGRRKEMIKGELHFILQSGFGTDKIFSEYGMTELLSQAYSLGNELFYPVPWMKILIREVEDPFQILPNGKSGGINVIDFANYYSCSFIETQDLGKTFDNGSFEILGRYDHSDIRGCNLMLD
jgi:hypothetical protein